MPAKPSLGLYFNDYSIELSQISGDGVRLERFNQLSLLTGLVVNGEIKNNIAFAQVLQQLFLTAKPGPVDLNNDVVIGVNDSRVFLSEFVVQNIPGKNINDAIDYQVRSLLPVLPTGVETDWQIIGRSNEGQIEVLLTAIPRDIINSYVSVCTSVGLRVVAVEPAVFANIRVIDQSLYHGKNQLLVYLGESFGVFSFITSGNPRFSDFLPQSEIEKKGKIVQTVLAYINFANSKHPNRPVTEVIISGSLQGIDKIATDLKAQNINTVIAVSRLADSQVANHTLLYTSHGLGLKTFDQQPSINVLPLDFRLEAIRHKLTDSWKKVLAVLFILSILILVGLTYLFQQMRVNKSRLIRLKAQYDETLSLPASQLRIRQADQVNQITGQLLSLREITGGEELILRELSSITPEGVTFSSVVINRNSGIKKLSDKGNSWVITGTAESRPVVLDFYKNLLSIQGFSDGKLYFGSLEKDIGLTFRIANVETK
ncbi:MAG: Type IV pilus biogenesis protein PilM [uncultured bacterium]|nr:MAG: Type IV pilus biogenesis protein PilM [uncultured bacterium]